MTEDEKQQLHKLLGKLPTLDINKIDNELLTSIELTGQQIPTRILEALFRFRRQPNDYGTLLFCDLTVDPNLPDTPADGRPSSEKQTSISEYGLLMLMLPLGEPIDYSDEKGGALIQNICPIKGQETKQENTGSTFLEFHVEDGFHPYKPDHLALFCLRSDHEKVAQTASACIKKVLHKLPSTAIALLREPLYRMNLSTSFTKEKEKTISTTNIPVLSGNLLEPEMNIDYFLKKATEHKAQWALDVLKKMLLQSAISFSLEPGDLIIIDNRLAAHDRTGFKPQYDGNDQWLQRMFTVSDFRRSSYSRGIGQHVCTPLNVELNL